MHWDDLALLRVIDQLEQAEISSLSNGRFLMEKAAQPDHPDPSRDYIPFVHELLLARQAGYVQFVEDRWVTAAPTNDPNQWLHQIRDIRLTLSGRDRARGRIVIVPPPDPAEDDGRPIAGLTLGAIAHAIADTYTASQLPTFLLDSRLPREYVPHDVTDNKWECVRDVLISLHDDGSAARRTLRTFIGEWLSDRLHTGPSQEVRKQILSQLYRQGWCVRQERLVVGQPDDRELAAVVTSAETDFTMQTLQTLEGVFRRFGRGARLLMERGRHRRGIEILDEYDVQDQLHAILATLFDDVRPEEYSPSRGGAGARLDFLLKSERVAVETKMMKRSLTSKTIGEQLMIDVERYQAHPDCRALAALVYDPEQLITNPRGLERDLSSDSADMRVLVVVSA